VIVATSFLSFKQKDIAESTADLLLEQNGTPKTKK